MTGPIADAPGPAPKRRRRPRLALSVRGLMVLVLVVGGLLGWKARKASLQRRAVAEIERAGGKVCFDYQINAKGQFFATAQPPARGWYRRRLGEEYFWQPRWVYFAGPMGPETATTGEATFENAPALDGVEKLTVSRVAIGDAGMARLAAMPRLKDVHLYPNSITESALTSLAGIPDLERIQVQVGDAHLTGAILARFAGLRKLQLLSISARQSSAPTPLVPADFAPLAKLLSLRGLTIRPAPADESCLEPLLDLPALVGLGLEGTRATDAGLARLAGKKNLVNLTLTDGGVTDAGLALLTGLPKLTSLTLRLPTPGSNAKITDAGLAQLGKIRSLQSLAIDGRKFTDAGLAALDGLAFFTLRLTGIEATKGGLDRLVAGRPLGLLELSGPGLTDAALAGLVTKIPRVSLLVLSRSAVTDAGMAHLAALPRLSSVLLDETALTDAGLAAIGRSAPRLRTVGARGTAVTAAGVASLRAARPNASVLWGPVGENRID